MKGLLDGRGRGGWGRVEAVVDQGEERWSRAKLLLSFGGVKGIRTRTGWAAGDGETWRLTGESAEQLYRDLSWNSVVLSCTVMGRAARGQASEGQSNCMPNQVYECRCE